MTDSINLGQKRLHPNEDTGVDAGYKRAKTEPALSQTTNSTPVSLEIADKQQIALKLA